MAHGTDEEIKREAPVFCVAARTPGGRLMYLYQLTLQTASGICQAVYGSFSAVRAPCHPLAHSLRWPRRAALRLRR